MFIVIEGIDGAGHTTQIDFLKKFFTNNNEKIHFIKTPNKNLPIGKAYYAYLNREYDINKEAVFLLCASDVISNKEIIENARKLNENIISERYITSTLAYQAANGFDFDKGINLINLINFPKADMILYLDISPETTIERKSKTKKLDRHESDINFLYKVKDYYEKQIDINFLGKWYRIDGEKDAIDVHKKILKIIKDKIK